MEAIEWLKSRWRSSGIESGDILLLHSNILRTLRILKQKGFQPSVKILLESFINSVGKDGTLLFPLFNFDFVKGIAFDMKSTKSHMGALSEAARNYPKAVRTGHPVYSFCAIGRLSHKFSGVDNVSGYGIDSPFGILRKLDGKVAVLDVEENLSMTFHHHVEEMMSVPYRYMKNFTGNYINLKGLKEEKTYSIYVRNLEKNVQTELDPIGKKLWEASIYKGDYPNEETGLRIARVNEIFDYVSNIISCGDALGNLYKIED